MKAAIAAAAVVLALGFAPGAGAATPQPDTLGLRLTPAPIHVDEGDRTVTAVNLSGGLTLDVTLTASTGYAVEPATFTLTPDAEQVVRVTTVNPEQDGTLAAVATTTQGTGTIRSAINLTTRFVHASWLALHPQALPLALIVVLSAVLVGVWVVRRALSAHGARRPVSRSH